MTYDPSESPRNLTAVPDEDDQKNAEDNVRRMTYLQNEIDALHAALGMFRSKGWQRVQANLFEQLQAAHAAILDNRIATMEGIAFVRGQIHAFQYLFNLEQETKQRQEFLKQELQEAQAADTL